MSSSYDSAFIVAERAIFTKHLEICLDGIAENDSSVYDGDVHEHKNFTRRETFLFYLKWMSDVWIGEALSSIETVANSALCFEESL